VRFLGICRDPWLKFRERNQRGLGLDWIGLKLKAEMNERRDIVTEDCRYSRANLIVG